MNPSPDSPSFTWSDLDPAAGHKLRLLIEASAGTGKTWTLERIVVRYLVGRRLPLSSMLIVTFTRKATRELRTRLRTLLARLVADEAFAAEMLAEIGLDAGRVGDWRSLIRTELRNFHRADIHTIHGFAKAALDRHPAESGSLAGQRIDNACLSEIIHDQLMSSLVSGRVEIRFAHGPGFGDPPAVLSGENLDFCLDRAYDSLACKSAGDLVDQLQEMQEKGIFDPAGTQFGISGYPGLPALWGCLFDRHWPACLALFGADATAAPSGADPLQREALRQDLALRLPELDLSKDEKLQEAVSRICAFSLARWLLAALESYRERQARFLDRMGHNDLLLRLDRACGDGSLLLEQLRQEYRLVLIDEFQDTDALQWRIFSRLATQADLIAVGDPKQAIYSFRGADLNTYLHARSALAHSRVLDRNFRSSPDLIDRLNRLFTGSFRPGQAGESARLEYRPVKPGKTGQCEMLVDARSGRPLDSLQAFSFDPPETDRALRSAEFKRHALAAMVADVRRLVDGSIQYRIAPGLARPLLASDLTVLCATGSDCRLVRDELIGTGISASLSGQGRLLASQEAVELQILLDALADPTDPSRVRAVALTRFFGLASDALRNPDGSLEPIMEQLADWHRGFGRMGLAGIHARLEPLMRPRLISNQGQGALRTLTNLQHVIELFLDNLDGRQIVVRAIGQEYRNFRHESSLQDEIPLRRDSDAPSVRVMTMHSAKGLEFPVVFLFGNFSKVEVRHGAVWYDLDASTTEGWKRAVDPWKSESGKDGHLRRMREEWQRLFYVAATRAKAALYLPAQAPDGSWLDQVIRSGALDDALAGPIAVEPEPLSTQADATAPDPGGSIAAIAADLAVRAPLPTAIPHGWHHVLYPEIERQSSFTGLSSQLIGRESTDETSMGFKPDTSEPSLESNSQSGFVQADAPALLPSGAAFGILFHQAMELVDFRLGDAATPAEARREQIRQFCSTEIEPVARRRTWGRGTPGWSSFGEAFAALLQSTLELQLPVPEGSPIPLHLAAADTMHRELAFNARIRQRGLIDSPAGDSPLTIPAGFLTGVIDLVFRHRGRWHLVDWKTNLVPDGDHQAVMESHHYGLQALIYQAAFHQFLCQRAGIRWDPRTGDGDETAAREIFDTRLGHTWYVFVRTRHAVDAGGTWPQLRDFQKKAGLYVS